MEPNSEDLDLPDIKLEHDVTFLTNENDSPSTNIYNIVPDSMLDIPETKTDIEQESTSDNTLPVLLVKTSEIRKAVKQENQFHKSTKSGHNFHSTSEPTTKEITSCEPGVNPVGTCERCGKNNTLLVHNNDHNISIIGECPSCDVKSSTGPSLDLGCQDTAVVSPGPHFHSTSEPTTKETTSCEPGVNPVGTCEKCGKNKTVLVHNNNHSISIIGECPSCDVKSSTGPSLDLGCQDSAVVPPVQSPVLSIPVSSSVTTLMIGKNVVTPKKRSILKVSCHTSQGDLNGNISKILSAVKHLKSNLPTNQEATSKFILTKNKQVQQEINMRELKAKQTSTVVKFKCGFCTKVFNKFNLCREHQKEHVQSEFIQVDKTKDALKHHGNTSCQSELKEQSYSSRDNDGYQSEPIEIKPEVDKLVQETETETNGGDNCIIDDDDDDKIKIKEEANIENVAEEEVTNKDKWFKCGFCSRICTGFETFPTGCCRDEPQLSTTTKDYLRIYTCYKCGEIFNAWKEYMIHRETCSVTRLEISEERSDNQANTLMEKSDTTLKVTDIKTLTKGQVDIEKESKYNEIKETFYDPGVPKWTKCKNCRKVYVGVSENDKFNCICGSEEGVILAMNQVLQPYKCANCKEAFSTMKLYKDHNCFKVKKDKHASSVSEKTDNKIKNDTQTRIKQAMLNITKPLNDIDFGEDDDVMCYELDENSISVCEICNASFKTPLEYVDHLMTHQTEEDTDSCICPVCDKVCRDLNTLNKHRIAHEKRYQCSVCSKRFSFSGNLTDHMRIHTKIRPYVCEICGHTSINQSHLVSHRRTHTGEKPYVCNTENCGKAFATISNLYKHKKTHSDMRPFRCSTCFKAFRQPEHLSRHMRSHFNDRRYSCSICDKAFYRASHLARHNETIHRNDGPRRRRSRKR